MEHLRAQITGPGPAAGGLPGAPAPSGEAAPVSAAFAEELFEEGARAGATHLALARQAAALDRQARPGMGDGLALDREGQAFALEDSVPDSDLGLGDFLDVVNPLHHIPIVGNIYRALTGDTISGPARVAGAAIYGGPAGMMAGIVNAIAAEISGNDLGGTLIAGILGESPADDTIVAEAPQAAPDAESVPEAAATAASFAPPAPAGVLTGDAALSALLGDLRAVPELPMELPELAPAFGTAGASETRPGAGERPAGIHPAGAKATGHGFSERMLLGMDKYRALAIERGGAGRPALERTDRHL